MLEKSKYHFEPEHGWLNDPNGLCYYGGVYHAFFQHDPKAAETDWKAMYWGHAVSTDLKTWHELPLALCPDKPYDDTGCWSGSAIEKDGKLYLVYTSHAGVNCQTQSVAVSKDGVYFEKTDGNPVIAVPEKGLNTDFRDPYVFKYGDEYLMAVASADNENSYLLIYKSCDLESWAFKSVAISFPKGLYGMIECMSLVPVDGKWVFIFSITKKKDARIAFAVGDFDGSTFTVEHISFPERAFVLYAPQAFFSTDGRCLMMGWMTQYEMLKKYPDMPSSGVLSAPREIYLDGDGELCLRPAAEMLEFVTETDGAVKIDGTKISVTDDSGNTLLDTDVKGLNGAEKITDIKILRDSKTLEIFINGGRITYTLWAK